MRNIFTLPELRELFAERPQAATALPPEAGAPFPRKQDPTEF